MDANPDDESRQPFGLKLSIKCVACRRSGKCRAAGAFDMIVLRTGGIPKHHDGIANEFLDLSTVALDEGIRLTLDWMKDVYGKR